jgi:hypothetical protein
MATWIQNPYAPAGGGLPAGTTGQILTLNSSGLPSWQQPADWQAADQGFLAWNYDLPASLSGGTSALATAGTMTVMAIPVRAAILVTNINLMLAANGSVLTSGQCFAALYAGAGGSLIGVTADQSTAWGSGAAKLVTMPLAGGPFTVQPGIVYAGVWFNGTTGPAFTRTSSGATQLNLNLSTSLRWATANTGLTTTAPGTLGAFAQGSLVGYWAALS